MAPFGLSVFLSAFLLFALQPLVGKALLPWFGGSPATWTTCLLFFQVALLLGYVWADRVSRAASRRQALAHGAVVALALGALGAGALLWATPLLPDASWRPPDSQSPTLRALRILAAGPGLPYLALAATSPLLQAWFARVRPGASPWRLYALSNVGSLLALLAYPFVVEPLLPLRVQAWAWAAGFALFAVGLALCARAVLAAPADPAPAPAPAEAPRPTRRALWVLLAALPSLMLLAVTNHLCQEVAAVPFLWVVPLALYLLTFILCFDGDRWYARGRFVPALAVLLPACAALLLFRAPVVAQIVAFSLLLFATGMVCHGELAARRPDPAHLTGFYLSVAAGGALGGACVALVAPRLFDSFFELDAALLLTGLLAAVLLRDRSWLSGRRAVLARVGVNALVFLLGGLLVAHAVSARAGSLAASRGFFGALRVVRDLRGPDGAARVGLLHGATMHGFQVDGEGYRAQPTAYFTRRSGIGLALERHPRRLAGLPLRIGVVGLGIGTLAAYARPGDTIRFYEVSPEVVAFARDRRFFTYLSGAPGPVEVVVGDGRLALERELAESGPQGFDLLVMDAFGSDSVPVHLLTREAFALYARHLRAGPSVLAVNVLNRTLDLAPLVFRAAEDLGFAAAHVRSQPAKGEDDPLEFPGDWMLLAPDAAALGGFGLASTATARPAGPLPRLWTDDFSNPAALLKGWGL